MITYTSSNITGLARPHPLGFPALVLIATGICHGTIAPGGLPFLVCNIAELAGFSIDLATPRGVGHDLTWGPLTQDTRDSLPPLSSHAPTTKTTRTHSEDFPQPPPCSKTSDRGPPQSHSCAGPLRLQAMDIKLAPDVPQTASCAHRPCNGHPRCHLSCQLEGCSLLARSLSHTSGHREPPSWNLQRLSARDSSCTCGVSLFLRLSDTATASRNVF